MLLLVVLRISGMFESDISQSCRWFSPLKTGGIFVSLLILWMVSFSARRSHGGLVSTISKEDSECAGKSEFNRWLYVLPPFCRTTCATNSDDDPSARSLTIKSLALQNKILLISAIVIQTTIVPSLFANNMNMLLQYSIYVNDTCKAWHNNTHDCKHYTDY